MMSGCGHRIMRMKKLVRANATTKIDANIERMALGQGGLGVNNTRLNH
jgi:hypothetical protein